jgi:predicted secreted Zn-dependent protease
MLPRVWKKTYHCDLFFTFLCQNIFNHSKNHQNLKKKKKKPLSNAIKHVQNLHSLETDADL